MSRSGVLRICRECWSLTTGDNPCRCGKVAPVLSVGGASEAINALADVRELLWPRGNADATWSPDTIEAIARRLEFLRPVPPPAPKRPALRSVPR
jgi:hypothetical protein